MSNTNLGGGGNTDNYDRFADANQLGGDRERGERGGRGRGGRGYRGGGDGGYRPRRGRGYGGYDAEGGEQGEYRPRRGGFREGFGEGVAGEEGGEYRPRRGGYRGRGGRGGYEQNQEGGDGDQQQQEGGEYRPRGRGGRGGYRGGRGGYEGGRGRYPRGMRGGRGGAADDSNEYDNYKQSNEQQQEQEQQHKHTLPNVAEKNEPTEEELEEIERQYSRAFGGNKGNRPAAVAGPNANRSRRPDDSSHGTMFTGRPGRTQRNPRQRCNNFDTNEVEEMFKKRHNQTGISFENYEKIDVDLVPGDVDPVASFDGLDVEKPLMENLMRCGYKKPTPVQKYGVPVTLAGGDLLACAQTGSGKTAAFLIPVIQHILLKGVSPAKNHMSHPIGLVLAPVRELALQIYDETRKLAFCTDIWVDVVYGGMKYNSTFEQDILVACPGRLKDIFDRERISFSCVKFLILDEADRMLEMGFEEQIRYLCTPPASDMPNSDHRQTLLFSATFPEEIRNLARSYLRRRHYLLTVGRVGSTTRNISQVVLSGPGEKKDDILRELLKNQSVSDLVLIFVETKSKANDIFRMLSRLGIPCDTIHGDRSQPEREEALRDFKSGEKPILVATDVASRGLDIPNVTHVVQYDLPKSIDDYTHRIGRTGRAGNKGIATSFFDPGNRDRGIAQELVGYLEEHDQEVPGFLRDVVEELAEETFNRPAGGRGRRGGGGGGQRSGGAARGETWGDTRQQQPQRAHRAREVITEYNDGGI